jgi:putative ABC transport system substrate-binding protein
MNNRRFAWLMSSWLLGICTVASAADVAVLKSTDAPAWRPAIDALRRAVPNHTVTEYDLKNERAEADRVLGTLKGKGAILVALGPLAAQAAHETLPESPLVFGMIQDPGKAGLAPGPGVTGVAFAIPVKNQLAVFRFVNPRGVRVGVIFNEANTGRLVQDARAAASVVRLVLIERPVAADKDVPEALRSLLKGTEAIDALWIPPDPILLGEEARRYILGETLKAGKPAYGFSAALVSEGALVSDGPDVPSTGEQLGELVNRVAGGEKGKIEMLIPKAELVINKKIADKLKIEIPSDALRVASKVF